MRSQEFVEQLQQYFFFDFINGFHLAFIGVAAIAALAAILALAAIKRANASNQKEGAMAAG